MARLRATRSAYDLVLQYEQPGELGLMFDRTNPRKPTEPAPVQIPVTYVPIDKGQINDIAVDEWLWTNGVGGAGWGKETVLSYRDGGSSYGEFCWLRRLGVAQPAGKLEEIALPSVTRALTLGDFIRGQQFGTTNDLWLTTRNRTVINVQSGTGVHGVSERDIGAGHVTGGLAIFDAAGYSALYVGDTQGGIQELREGAGWQVGEPATARGYLEVTYWVLGQQMATQGLQGMAGTGAPVMIGVEQHGNGVYTVVGDPKVAANWSALRKVGTGGGTYPVRATIASNRTAWFGTGLGILGLDGLGHSPNLTKWVELIASWANCKAVTYWNEQIWFATDQGLSALTPDGRRVDLGRNLNFGAQTGQTPIYGRPRALGPSVDGLYVGYYNQETQTSYIGCLLVGEDGTHRWSMAEAVIPGEEVTYVQQIAGNDENPRLFIGTVDQTGHLHLYRQSLPKSGDPETDALHGGPFVASEHWQLTLSAWDAQNPNEKTYRRLATEAHYLGDDYPANTIDVGFAVDGGPSVVVGTATEHRWTGTPPAASIRGTEAQVQLTVRNEPGHPVVIRTVSVRYTPHPETLKVKSYPCIFGENVTTRTGMRDTRDPGIVLTHLEYLQRADPIPILDELGRVIEGVVEEVREVISEESDTQGWTVRATVTISTTRSPARFDQDQFDASVFA